MLSTDGCQGSSKAQETEPQGPDPGPGGERGQDEIISKTRPNSITFPGAEKSRRHHCGK